MLNLPNELRCMIISYLDVTSFCKLREACKWFSQDKLLKSMHTESKCLDDSESSSKDKIKYIHQTRDVQYITADKYCFAWVNFFDINHDIKYTLSEINNYELRYNIQLPLDIKKQLIERSICEHQISIDFNVAPVIKSDGTIVIKHSTYYITLEKGTPFTNIRYTFLISEAANRLANVYLQVHLPDDLKNEIFTEVKK